MVKNIPWSREEVESIVADYLHMLSQELAGQKYNKTEHRRNLASKLNGRSDTSIERKHQNISAVLLHLGCPYIEGYKPLPNHQSLLFDVVEDRMAKDELFNAVALSAAEQPAVAPLAVSFEHIFVDAPEVLLVAKESSRPYFSRGSPVIRDYLSREAHNRSLGEAGEALVVACERARLRVQGKRALSDRVEQVSRTKGDGVGYDVLSFEVDGRERFIEVKTTAFGRETPFYISRNEVSFSKEFAPQYQLYRLFRFRTAPPDIPTAGRGRRAMHAGSGHLLRKIFVAAARAM